MKQQQYWIICLILLVLFLWHVWFKKPSKSLTIKENFQSNSSTTNPSEFEDILDINETTRAKFIEILGLLLDNQGFANQIIIDHKLSSIRDLVRKNRRKINLKIKPILTQNQFKILNRYLLLRDIYFTSGKKLGDETKSIQFARQVEFVKPKELYKNKEQENTELNSFREQYHLKKNEYIDYEWIKNKVKGYIDDYGLIKVTKSIENLNEVFENYWQGIKFVNQSNLEAFPIGTVLYNHKTNSLLYKTKNNKWKISQRPDSINILKRISNDPLQTTKYFFNLINQEGNKDSKDIQSGYLFWIRTRSVFSLDRLYRKVDEINQDDYFSNNPIYDQLIKLPKGLDQRFTYLQRIKLITNWSKKQFKDDLERRIFLENIVIDLNNRVINIFDDISTYLLFHQHNDLSDFYLDSYLNINKPLNKWWSGKTINDIMILASELGQCYLPGVFSVKQVQKLPPIYKFIYNRNLYHTFWETVDVHISNLENHLKKVFKTALVKELIPVGRFCIFNNKSLRDYLAKYITCNQTKCDPNLKDMKEPARCGELKIKYQELVSLRQRYKCFKDSDTPLNPLNENKKQDQESNLFIDLDKIENSTDQINQIMGFRNLLFLDILKYCIKLHDCQTDNIEIKNCQDLIQKIDVRDSPKDKDLKTIPADETSDLYNEYKQNLKKYHDIFKEKELKELEPINHLANMEQKKSNYLSTTSDDFVGIVDDLVNLFHSKSTSPDDIEEFNNQIKDNLDLESDFNQYQEKIKQQLRGFEPNKDSDSYITKVKGIAYQLLHILTKEGRLMTSGMIIMIISMSFYFIDITS